jgi:predicted amidohydrolase
MSENSKFRTACVQLCSGLDIDANIKMASALIEEAARGGADFIVTPENTSLLALDRETLLAHTVAQDEDRALRAFQILADRLERWLLIGSLPIRVTPEMTANRSFLISPSGRIAAYYDKIHMFDVELPGGENYRESDYVQAGKRAVTAPLPWGRIGLSICYDLRFAALYRALAKDGAEFFSAPAAFTKTTGRAHWHVLLRARAIENGAFMFAAAQTGRHENGRDTYGHSLIISPWGEILAEAGEEPCVIFADIDPADAAAARGRIGALRHDRDFRIEHVSPA